MKVFKVFHLFFTIIWLGSLSLLPALLRQNIKDCFYFYSRYQLPSMIGSILCGIALLLSKLEKLKAGNFHLKLTCVLGLIALDLWLAKKSWQKKMGEELSQNSLWVVQIAVYLLILMALIAIIAWQK